MPRPSAGENGEGARRYADLVSGTAANALSLKQSAMVAAWEELIRQRQVVLVGCIRQEVLSGLRDPLAFERLRDHLRAFDDEPLTCDDYEEAARCFNRCRQAGIAGPNVDFLLCAVALRRHLEIFTTDADFHHYAKHLAIRLHHPRGAMP
jgi:predicted nucleic acid-binding protein